VSTPQQPVPAAVPADQPEDFRLTREPLEPAGLVLTAFGELDIATAPHLRATLAEAFAQGVTRVVIDLGSLFFLDSVAVAALLHARRQFGEEGRMAVVVTPDSYARLVFGVAGLSHCLDVFGTRDEAIAHVGG
jgi:anti-sigma B factor antagonist